MEAALGPPTDKQRPLQLHTISIGSSSQEACVSVGDMDPALRIVTALRRLHTQTRRKIISWLALSDPRPGCLWQPQPPPQQPQLCVHKAPLIQDHPRYVHPLPPPNQLLSSCRCLQSTVRLSLRTFNGHAACYGHCHRHSTDMPSTCIGHAATCNGHVTGMYRTCNGHATDIQLACHGHATDMQRACNGHATDTVRTRNGHPMDMQRTCHGHAACNGHVTDTSWKSNGHAMDMQVTCHGHATDIRGPAEECQKNTPHTAHHTTPHHTRCHTPRHTTHPHTTSHTARRRRHFAHRTTRHPPDRHRCTDVGNRICSFPLNLSFPLPM